MAPMMVLNAYAQISETGFKLTFDKPATPSPSQALGQLAVAFEPTSLRLGAFILWPRRSLKDEQGRLEIKRKEVRVSVHSALNLTK
jgi:hypothetical protein